MSSERVAQYTTKVMRVRKVARNGKPNPPDMLWKMSRGRMIKVPNKAARLLRMRGKSEWPQTIKQSTADRWNLQDLKQWEKVVRKKSRPGTDEKVIAHNIKDAVDKRGRIAMHNVFVSG